MSIQSMNILFGCCLAIVFLSSISNTNSYKIIDTESYFIPGHYQAAKRASHHNELLDVLYPSNRQGSLYDDEPSDLKSFNEVLDALSESSRSLSQEESFENDLDDDDDLDEESLNDLLNKNKFYDIETKADPRDEESESHSSLGAGHQYVSGGAGEGKQHLQPDGSMPNIEEVKTDEDLPAYCDPPNPCPVGYNGEDCDPRPYIEYTAEYSKNYQEQQNCMCDDDHNECSAKSSKSKSLEKVNDLIRNMQSLKQDDKFLSVVAKKSPRVKRDIKYNRRNPYLKGQAIKLHVAKKSSPIV